MNTNAILEQMMGTQFADNPQMQAMMAMMQQNNAAQQAQKEQEASELEKYSALLRKAVAKIDRLTARIGELEAELEEAEQFEGDIALALGACPLCWGSAHNCRSCRGRGKPGFFHHDPELYAAYVQPVVQKQLAMPSSQIVHPL
jgi:hypothetical protein